MPILGLPATIGFGPTKYEGVEVDLTPPPPVGVDLPIEIENLQNGDVLIYRAAESAWKNAPSEELVDGGNF